MLTEKENEKAVKELKSFIEKAGLKEGLIYNLKLKEDDAIFKGTESISFIIDQLPNAMYPHIGVNLYDKDAKLIGKMGFTKQEYFPSELDKKDPLFGPNRMYDAKFLKKFKEEKEVELNSDFYFGEKNYLEKILKEINEIISDNNLKETKNGK